ncbi:hypothetical protein GCM10011321_35960 [Youhaiella tibetensis]|uniref:Uncharacterized protein n=1 Tax=Paradevosia tibetensis TaxID=1447062 RepID=A0A5B9DSN5_9HYPH|nr:hypothetical protein [Youhaiella tibetensis]AKR57522.1 hypothetical protein XM25_17380 [Devosia sp. H5989]QEE22450.1 hypothetical protein FNA67_20790 [Youhaiella tibetensis]GGF42160.1 hypothetical protein GCM10011321_35960 [Youhaiella tibetensis]
MNKIMLTTAAALVLSAGAALAQTTPDFATTDGDKSGEVSWEELHVQYPQVTEEEFKNADADNSGGLNEEEFVKVATPGTGSLTSDTPKDGESQNEATTPPAQ